MESSDHGLSEYLYNVLVVPFILTQDREEVNPSHCFCARLGFLFSNKITRSWNFLAGGTWVDASLIDNAWYGFTLNAEHKISGVPWGTQSIGQKNV